MNVIESEHGSVVLAPENDARFLTIFTLTCSTVGIVLSAAALTLLFLTACLFAEWRQNYKNQILIQLMISRFFYTVVRYFYDIRNVFSLCVNDGCVIYLDVLAMVYTEALLVSWMFIFTRNMYESLVNVLVVRVPNIWVISTLAWAVPGCVSFLYNLLFNLQNNHDLTFFVLYLVLLKWPILITNAVTLFLILKSILKTNLSNKENNKRIIFVMLVLICMFCLQQVLHDIIKIMHVFFITSNIVSYYILIFSNIMLIYHCAFSIIFWVFGNENTRKLWKTRWKKSRLKPNIIKAREDQVIPKY